MAKQNEKAQVMAKVDSKKFSVKSVFENLAKSTAGLMKTSKGGRKTSIYKEELFADCTDKEKKRLRKKLRDNLQALADSVKSTQNEQDKKQLINAFIDFYKSAFVINDFSLSSVCSENMQADKKKNLQNLLDLAKKYTSK